MSTTTEPFLYAVIADGLVANVAVLAEAIPPLPEAGEDDPWAQMRGWIPLAGLDPQPGIGWTFSGGTFSPPPVEEPEPPQISADPVVVALVRAFASDQDPDHAKPWVQPTGAHDAYLPGAIVAHGGASWRNDLAVMNVWEPGTQGAGWTNLTPPAPGEIPEWVQPTGAHDAYNVGDRVRYQGQVWVSTVAGNVWAPGTFGWDQEPAG
jgi:hypothetical protein